MMVMDIPHFKEIIIMAMYCQKCGFRSNEVKSSGRISKLATKITLIVEDENDLKREVIKSDSAGIEIPQLQLTLTEGGMGGVYTTVEGLLEKMYDALAQVVHPSSTCSSSCRDYEDFMEKLRRMKEGDASLLPFTLLINDPLSNSFIGPVPQTQKNVHHSIVSTTQSLVIERNDDGNSHGDNTHHEHSNHHLIVEEYERTFEQNEELGLNDIKTEK
jgi:zinc finger protein